MKNKDENKQKDAIQKEQHLIAKQNSSDEIVKILVNNKFTISEAYDVLRIASKKLGQQHIKFSR
jgi:hypothetical protein